MSDPAKPEPFTDVTFPAAYPQEAVAEHEVLMSFGGDPEAVAFRAWWGAEGAAAFNQWLKRDRGERAE